METSPLMRHLDSKAHVQYGTLSTDMETSQALGAERLWPSYRQLTHGYRSDLYITLLKAYNHSPCTAYRSTHHVSSVDWVPQ